MKSSSKVSVVRREGLASVKVYYGRYLLQLISVNIPAVEIAIAVAAPCTDFQGFGVWSLESAIY